MPQMASAVRTIQVRSSRAPRWQKRGGTARGDRGLKEIGLIRSDFPGCYLFDPSLTTRSSERWPLRYKVEG